jgi:hypothetical protein
MPVEGGVSNTVCIGAVSDYVVEHFCSLQELMHGRWRVIDPRLPSPVVLYTAIDYLLPEFYELGRLRSERAAELA